MTTSASGARRVGFMLQVRQMALGRDIKIPPTSWSPPCRPGLAATLLPITAARLSEKKFGLKFFFFFFFVVEMKHFCSLVQGHWHPPSPVPRRSRLRAVCWVCCWIKSVAVTLRWTRKNPTNFKWEVLAGSQPVLAGLPTVPP